jgi:hypothetical protein
MQSGVLSDPRASDRFMFFFSLPVLAATGYNSLSKWTLPRPAAVHLFVSDLLLELQFSKASFAGF